MGNDGKNSLWSKRIFFVFLIVPILAFGFFNLYRIYDRLYVETLAIIRSSDIGLKEAVVVNFAVPVLKADYGNGVRITPAEDVSISFDQKKRKMTITPKNHWLPEMKYQIQLPEGRTAMLTKINSQEMFFQTTEYPKIKEVFPGDRAKDIVLGAEDPIIVDFTKSTAGFFIKFVLDPESDVVYQNNSDKTQFKLLPKDKIHEGKQYSLKISAKVLDDERGNYQELYAGTFETLPPAPVTWEKDYQLRLDQAKKFTQAKVESGKYIDVNLKTQIMTIFENGLLLDAFLVSSGKRGMDTPVMQSKIYNKAPRPFSKTYGLYMPYWMAFLSDGKMGVHELPEWPGGYKEGASHLGIPVSHGCIRLGIGPAKTVYEWAEIGTPIYIY